MEPQAGARNGHAPPLPAPPVVVVAVAHDPSSEHFGALVGALAGQDYPNMRVLVVDVGSGWDLATHVAGMLPSARVLHLAPGAGFGAAANRVLDVAPDVGYYLFCHDDVVPEPHSLSELVEIATAYDAGVVGPKLVTWDDPDRLLQVGMSADRIGTAMPFVEPGELDQGQHDGLREVLTVPGAFTLVRADVFERVGGFDEAISLLGDDLSLCWRAHVAGAPVLVTSSTRVRHAQVFSSGVSPAARRALVDRHRLRALLTCYGILRLALVLPQALLVTAAEVLAGVVTGHGRRAQDAVGAWLWNVRRLRSMLAARRHVRRIRRVPDRKVARFQVRGIVGPRLRLRRIGDDAKLAAARPSVAVDLEDDAVAAAPGVMLVWVALVAVLVFGSRHLVTGFVPAVGDLVPFDAEPGALLAEWASGWRHVGLGSAAAAPTALGAIGGLGALLGGQMGLLRTILTLGLVPVGILGAHRLLRPSGLRWAQAAAAVAYAAVPVPYNALSNGRWAALAAYAGAPWLLARLARASQTAPFRPADAPLAVVAHPLGWHVVAVGTVTGLVGVLVPAAPVLLAVLAGALVVGSLLVFELRGVARVAAAALGGAVVAGLLHVPSALDLLRTRAGVEAWLGLDRTGDDMSLPQLLSFETGELGAAPLGFALVAAATVPLLVGRSWRLAWAVRGWTVALAFWSLVWVRQQGWGDLPLPPTDVLLAPAGAGVALAIALGVAAIEADVRGRSHRLGARRLVAAVGVVALLASAAPVVAASFDGRWHAPQGDFAALLRFVDEDVRDVPSRVLWLGDPEVVPGGAGWEWRNGVSYATSLEGGRGLRDLWPGPAPGATARIGEALDAAADGRTTRLGHLLAPMSVQYIAVPQRLAPSPFTSEVRPVPSGVIQALDAQLDLQRVVIDPAVELYRNTAFVPVRSLLTDGGPPTGDAGEAGGGEGLDTTSLAALQRLDLTGSLVNPLTPVLPERDGVGYRGALPPDLTLLQSWTASDRWRLEVDGQVAPARRAFGWASAVDTGDGGEAVLSYRTPASYLVLLGVQVALWLAVTVAVVRMGVAGDGGASLPYSRSPASGAGLLSPRKRRRPRPSLARPAHTRRSPADTPPLPSDPVRVGR